MDIKKICSIQKRCEKNLMKKANVISVGVGFKNKNGKPTKKVCLVVGVVKKVKTEKLSKQDMIPATIEDTDTDVIEVGVIRAFPRKRKKKITKSMRAMAEVDPTNKFRPAMPGISIAHKNVTAGTFGCVVYKNGEKYILSNNHVLANSNDAAVGDDIYQPGPHDGGSTLDKIGELDSFVTIVYQEDDPGGGGSGGGGGVTCPIASGAASVANIAAKALKRKHRLLAVNPEAVTNDIDAALAKPTNENDIIEDIAQIGKPTGTAEATLGMDVQKYGRTTKYTTGQILQMNVTVSVSYGVNKTAVFTGQLMAGAMSAGGDSGSSLLDMSGNLVGLLYAGSEATTVFNTIQKVFDLLGVSLGSGSQSVV